MSDKSLEERLLAIVDWIQEGRERGGLREPDPAELRTLAVEAGRLERTNRKLSGRILHKMARIEALKRVMDDAFEIDESGYVCASYDGWEPIPGEKQDMYLAALNPENTEPPREEKAATG